MAVAPSSGASGTHSTVMPSARNSPRSSAIRSGSRLSDAAGMAMRTVRGSGGAGAAAVPPLAAGALVPAGGGAGGAGAGAHAGPHSARRIPRTSARRRMPSSPTDTWMPPRGTPCPRGTANAAVAEYNRGHSGRRVEVATGGTRDEIRAHEPYLAQARHGASRSLRAALAGAGALRRAGLRLRLRRGAPHLPDREPEPVAAAVRGRGRRPYPPHAARRDGLAGAALRPAAR